MPSSENFADIVTAHLDDMYALAYQFTGSRQHAEDLVQDLFVNLSLKRYAEREIRRPKAWLAAILYRIFVDQWRRQKRSPVIYGVLDCEQQPEQGSDSPLQHCEQQQKTAQALQVLRQLNERHRQMILLHDIHEYTMNEISDIMQLPLGTVKSNIHRAKKHISVILHEMNTTAVQGDQINERTGNDPGASTAENVTDIPGIEYLEESPL